MLPGLPHHRRAGRPRLRPSVHPSVCLSVHPSIHSIRAGKITSPWLSFLILPSSRHRVDRVSRFLAKIPRPRETRRRGSRDYFDENKDDGTDEGGVGGWKRRYGDHNYRLLIFVNAHDRRIRERRRRQREETWRKLGYQRTPGSVLSLSP